jgi:hypothetical protein
MVEALDREQVVARASTDEDAPSVVRGKRRRRTRRIILLAAVAAIAIVIVAFLAVPPMKGFIAQMYLHDGDFVEYDVTGSALLIPFSGSLRIDISNVSQDGFTATLTTVGVPGGGTVTRDYGWDDSILGDMYIGDKVGTAQISTPWGEKTVDRHFLQNETGA